MKNPADQNIKAKQGFETSLNVLYDEFQEVKTHSQNIEIRLTHLEAIIKDLIQHLRKLPIASAGDAANVTLNQYIDKSVLKEEELELEEELKKAELTLKESEERKREEEVDIEGVTTNWHYFIAKKGGFNEVLYMTVQDFLNLREDPKQLLTFLLEKRDKEVQERLEYLKVEYQKLQGHQLQQHFRELWELHHNFLEKKLLRTWKEEIFLEAFEAFISWLSK